MIRNEQEYQEALRRFKLDVEVLEKQRAGLAAEGLTQEEIQAVMEPLFSFREQLLEEIEWYENARRGNFAPIDRLTALGRLLIGARIASGLSQRTLAQKLGVSEQAVSRDERNEYHGITLERAQRILDVLKFGVSTTMEELPGSHVVGSLVTEPPGDSLGDQPEESEALIGSEHTA